MLIESCPETCDIPCGSFMEFSFLTNFRLSGIPGLLDSDNVLKLEETAFGFIAARKLTIDQPDVVFELDSVTLKGQKEVDLETRFRRLQETTTSTVDVSIFFSGFALDMTLGAILHLIGTSLVDENFVMILQDTSSFYSRVQIEAISDTTSSIASDDNTNQGSHSGIIVVVPLLVFLCLGLGLAVYHRRTGRWFPCKSPVASSDRNEAETPSSPKSNSLEVEESKEEDSEATHSNTDTPNWLEHRRIYSTDFKICLNALSAPEDGLGK